ncbi:MAG: lysylphosphatidylglycerol synthase transmembrane domain-containing protein [Flavobacterium sp.]|nr:lysylphosphatidylglycerol synthase transmembrane domain-containing protein [Flavobacterium sp.]
MKKQLNKWLSILLPIALGVYLTFYAYNQFSSAQLQEIKGYFEHANYNYIVLALVIAVFGNMSRAYRWKYSLDHLGYPTTFATNYMAINICYLLNLTVPKSGEISRALILKKYNDIPFDKGFGTIVAERIIDMLVLLSFILAAFFVQFSVVKSFILDNKGWYLAHTCFIWGSYVLMFYCTLFALPQTSSIPFSAVVTAFVVGSIAIAFTNSGFGSYPFMIAKILAVYGIAETAGNAFGWIVWSSQMFLVLILGLLSFLFLPLANRSR